MFNDYFLKYVYRNPKTDNHLVFGLFNFKITYHELLSLKLLPFPD